VETPHDENPASPDSNVAFDELKLRYKRLGEAVGAPPDLFDPDDHD
jgi:hypothetical protein